METLPLSSANLQELLEFLGESYCEEVILKLLPIEEAHEIKQWCKQHNASAMDAIRSAYHGDLAGMALTEMVMTPMRAAALLFARDKGPLFMNQLLARAVMSLQRIISDAYRRMLTDKATALSQEPQPAPPAAEPATEFIDLKSNPPPVPRFRAGAYNPADDTHLDACIEKIAELEGGQTGPLMLSKWGRYWLRTHRKVDTTKEDLLARFKDPKHQKLHRPRGQRRSAT